MKKIKPSFPLVHLLIAMTFIGLSIMFIITPYRDTGMTIGSILFGSVGLTMLWFIDYFFMTIEMGGDKFKCRGYFLLRKYQLTIDQIKGYEIHQKVDQFNGLHEEFQIITKENNKLLFLRIVYGDYDSVISMCKSELEFLDYKELRHAKLLGRIIPIMFLMSGILAGLVGLLKLLR